jgi:hypothetical protein
MNREQAEKSVMEQMAQMPAWIEKVAHLKQGAASQ